MKFSEKQLEDIIFNSDNSFLREKGFYIYGKKFRQLNIAGYGVADLICVSRSGQLLNIDIIELKRDEISIGSFMQALRYLDGIRHYLRKRRFDYTVKFTIKLCGNSITDNRELNLMTKYINVYPFIDIDFYTYRFTVDGIFFDKNDALYELKYDPFNDVKCKKKESEFTYF